jgi:hypothetical protein
MLLKYECGMVYIVHFVAVAFINLIANKVRKSRVEAG